MRFTGRLRTLGATHRWAALLMGLLWAAAPLLAAVHANAEVHRYCAQHGTLEEAAEHPGGEVLATGREASPRSSRAATVADAAQGPSPHSDCAFSRCCRFGQVLTRFVLQATGQLQQTAILLPSPDRRAPALAVIRLAPKTSPPI